MELLDKQTIFRTNNVTTLSYILIQTQAKYTFSHINYKHPDNVSLIKTCEY